MLFKLFAALCLSTFLAATSQADPPAHWSQVKTEHFTVITDAGDFQARHNAGQLERMHAVFAKLLPNSADDAGSRIVVLALRDRRSFQALEPASYLARRSMDLAGLFMHGQDKNYILLRLDTSGDHPYATVFHEYTHYMLRHAGYLPVWLNEGLAQFYQNTDIFEHDVRLGQPDTTSLLFLRQRKLMPLEALFQVDHNSPYYHEQDKGNIFYAESWALTHFLFMQDFGRTPGRLHTYAQLLMKGESPITAAQHAFGDLRLLERQLTDYIAHGEYKALTMPLQNAIDERTLYARSLPTPEVDAIRADILVRNARTGEAATLATAVLKQDPANAQALESMGLIKLREGDMDAARRWFGKAVALHSDSFLAYYYYGMLSISDGFRTDRATADVLRKAVALNSHYAASLDSLAQYDAMNHDNLDEAQRMSTGAVALEPRNIEYRLHDAEIRVLRHEVPAALSGLQATEKLAQTPEDRARVQARLDQVQHTQVPTAQPDRPHLSSAIETADAAMQSMDLSPAANLQGTYPEPLASAPIEEVEPTSPDGLPAAEEKHTVTGKLHHVGCSASKGITLLVEGAASAVSLHSNDMSGASYVSGTLLSARELNPCRDFEGLQATVTYNSGDDRSLAGQIVSVELDR